MGGTIVAAIALLALALSQPASASQQLVSSAGVVTLRPGATLTQRFTPHLDNPSALTLQFPDFGGKLPPVLHMNVRGPDGSTLGSWYFPPALSGSGSFTAQLPRSPSARRGAYTLELTDVPDAIWVSGYALDPAADTDAGIDRVLLFLDGPPGKGAYLGEASTNQSRPDIATQYGASKFTLSGWQFVWRSTGVRGGRHRLFVYAHSTVSDVWTGIIRPVALLPSHGAVGAGHGTAGQPGVNPGVRPLVSAGNSKIVVGVDSPLTETIPSAARAVDVAYGPRGSAQGGRLSLDHRSLTGNLALTIMYRMPAGTYLTRLPGLLIADTPKETAALMAVTVGGWLLGLAATLALVIAVALRRQPHSNQ